jgi:hypothetical protein
MSTIDREWTSEDEAKWAEEDARTCYFCDTVDGHDCDCRLSPYPKCEECHTAFGVTHAETGERVSCECGAERTVEPVYPDYSAQRDAAGNEDDYGYLDSISDDSVACFGPEEC